MEVFQTDSHYIFVKRDKSLWWHRRTSEFSIKAGWDLSSVDDIECIGVTHGIVGVISLPNVYEPHLVVVKEATAVGVLYPPHLVYKIKSICILSAEEPDTDLPNCTKHTKSNQSTPTHSVSASNNNNANVPSSGGGSSKSTKLFEGMNKTWGAVKSAGNTIKNTTQQAANLATKQVKSSVGIREPKHIERRITEELHKVFDETDSFYFSFDCDITNNLQRHGANLEDNQSQADERFFWNMHMIRDLINLNDKTWILPVIQGFMQVENCVIGNECFTLALVSRRSRHRAGTRYKRRGVDEKGNCANYVETEQILSFRHHQLSFTQVRGSVPIFWSQPGYKYRPPPRLDRGVAETQKAFELHFTKELETYGRVCIVNLVEQSGKEKTIGDAYADHVVKFNKELLIYVTFDFHEYCRGMRFENVSALIDAVGPEAGAMGFHWRDQRGMICNQKSVFRVNCMDCLDRTNVVQTAIGKAVLESQLVKLGLSPPYTPIPEQLKSPFMVLWANNGDIISRQYAGTNALKGDYTRTGERKISGMMKDGMNSANRFFIQNFADSFRQCIIDLMQGQLLRAEELQEDEVLETIIQILTPETRPPLRGYYNPGVLGPELQLIESIVTTSYYLARFKDSYRQATIDLMLGNQVSSESLSALGGQAGPDENDGTENAEHAKLLVEDCRRLLLGTAQYPVGAWGLIDADPSSGDANETEVDSILLLTDDCYIVAEYDSHLDKIVRFEKVQLTQVRLIEFGMHQQTKIFQGSAPAHLCLRFNYSVDGQEGYFHMFRSANLRFFNNMAYVIKTQEELTESLSSIVEMFRIALCNAGNTDVRYITGGVLQRRKSKLPTLDVPKGMPRNLSESQLVQLSSKALSNVAGQFSKLGQTFKKPSGANHQQAHPSSLAATTNPQVMRQTGGNEIESGQEAEKAVFTLGRKQRNSNSASSTDTDEHDNSLYEPEVDSDVEIAMDKSNYNENAFLPSVGIVMGNQKEDSPSSSDEIRQLEQKDSMCKTTEDVLTISITSVTDHVTLPTGLLENAPPIRPITPNPLICVQAQEVYDDGEEEVKPVPSTSPRDLSLPLGLSTQPEANKLKQLTSPLSKLAKNIGLNLDPRKIATKTGVLSPTSLSEENTPPERGPNSRDHLLDLWEAEKCKTKLIAL
ncbi:phosphatidylinositide phosphatase SAC2 isoform X1 [Drosophila subpulchrella]|uniref:phosphatidylinositide phosphatase SAC2 isoform X1 n=1 Tax=Drosophila subpulchrella TaxID=1486046 RepID=UPI0018A12B5F|nr:phosphatidylinositide phosphatase SAC2 isoform X1 [Drosophila subpulchrella]